MKLETSYSRGKLKAICIVSENDEEKAFLEKIEKVTPRIKITYQIVKTEVKRK